MGWKTISGGLIAGVGFLSQPEVFNILPEKVASVVTVAGGLLTVIGARHAIAKSSISIPLPPIR